MSRSFSRLPRRAVCALALVLSSGAASAGPLAPFLPKDGVIVGHAVTFSIPPEEDAIARRFRHAVRDDMDFFKKAMTGAKAGQAIPYDKRMGITEDEYRQLLAMKSQVHEGAAVKVAVKTGPDGAVSFTPETDTGAVLKEVSFPAGESSAETPYGPLAIVNPIKQTDAAAPIGVWNGIEWARTSNDPDSPAAKIAFGRREADGSGVMYYQVAPYAGHAEKSLVVFYKID